MGWSMQPVLEHLKPKLQENDHALLTALVAAMSFKEKLPELDNFEMWRNAKVVPIE